MRRFVVVGHRAVTDHGFSLDDLAGGAGRLDVLLRCVNSAFFLSHALRRDTELYLILLGQPEPPKALKLVGEELRYLNPDERSTAALVRSALMRRDLGPGWTQSTPGIYVSRAGLAEVLDELAGAGEAAGNWQLVYLKEDGAPLENAPLSKDVTFVLGDDRDLDAGEEGLVMARSPTRASLGPKSLHTDHCIVLAHAALDRAGL